MSCAFFNYTTHTTIPDYAKRVNKDLTEGAINITVAIGFYLFL
jgi:hypothetical protein